MRSTFKIAFYVNRNKEKDGLVPVLGRITINGFITPFSCKQSIAPKLWDTKSNWAIGKSEQPLKLNRVLDNIRAQITNIINFFRIRKPVLMPRWLGIPGKG